MTCSNHIQIWVWRWRNGDRGRLYAVLTLLFLLFFTFYEVQYKTGIEIIPFLPVDQRGFDLYSTELLSEVEVSPAAKEQPKRGGLFCWVMTTSVFHKTRLPAVNESWISKCDASHFLTDSHRFLNERTPYHTVFRRLPSSYFKLFWKTRLALFYIYQNISSEFDWYYKADDDTYAIVENLREFLADYDPDKPYYFGFRLRRRAPNHGYNAGGSGYILSRAAMKIFAEELFEDRQSCPFHEWEDYAIARCLWSRGIYAQDTRDVEKRQRFLPWRPEQHFRGDLTKSFIMDPLDHRGFSIFHENLVAMHHLSAEEIRLIHGMLYGSLKVVPLSGHRLRSTAPPMRLAVILFLLPLVLSRGISKHKPFQASRALDSPIYDPVPCVPPPFLERLPFETRRKIENIWRDYKEGDCWVEMARTRNLLLQVPLEQRGNAGPKQCKAPEILRALPLRAQRRIMAIWKERDPKGDCREQQKKTRLILLNLPASLKLLLHPPAFDCAPPHFIDRLEWDLQVKLRRLWDGYKEGQPCAERIDAQLNLLEQNNISLQSFQMPPLSMFHRLELIRKLKRASLA